MFRVIRILVAASFLLVVSTSSRADWFILENPITGTPEAIWADTPQSQTTTTSNIIYSFLDGQSWAPSITLNTLGSPTASPALAFDEDGGRRAVWDNGDGTILLKSLPASGGSWSDAIVLSAEGEMASRPRAVVVGDDTFVVYEVTIPETSLRTAKASKLDPEGTVERSVLSETNRMAPIQVELHMERGLLWADWIDSDKDLGYRVWTNGEWAVLQTEAYDGDGDVKHARDRVRDHVLNGQ